MIQFKYLIAAVDFIFFLLMALIALMGMKKKDNTDGWLCLVVGLLPVANMIAILE